MVKTLKMIVICIFGSAFMSSCLKNSEAPAYTELYSVIKSNTGLTYFSSDQGIDLYPENGIFNPQWGKAGDRILVGFHYYPSTVSENTTKMNITVENLYFVQTLDSALPSTVDTVGFGVFFHDDDNIKNGIIAWAAQNYLTAIFLLKYTDPTKHIVGFIEEDELFRNDTLFLSLWHNAKEEGKSQTARSHMALNLSGYNSYLSARDSTVISIRYDAENLYSSTVDKRTCNVIYRKKYNK
ncbi:MAG: hypothetical protein LBK97_02210 [Prevotellaceae bacterium]|jgi:hypothetical protein|nr:hypothetical protein [Prevotellaceae bacterium]